MGGENAKIFLPGMNSRLLRVFYGIIGGKHAPARGLAPPGRGGEEDGG